MPPKENDKIIVINFGGRMKKTIFFFIFSTYLPLFLLKFQAGELVSHHHVFSGISCFSGSEVHQKYAMWVLVGCGMKFRIQ